MNLHGRRKNLKNSFQYDLFDVIKETIIHLIAPGQNNPDIIKGKFKTYYLQKVRNNKKYHMPSVSADNIDMKIFVNFLKSKLELVQET